MQKKINKSLVGIILASGSGSRMKSSIPKQYLSYLNFKSVDDKNNKFRKVNFGVRICLV